MKEKLKNLVRCTLLQAVALYVIMDILFCLL